MALSPDGRQLAVVHADSNQVTLIDTQRFAVVRTVTFAPRITLLDQLPLAPQPVEAKGLWDSSRRQAVFSVDGQRLYVFGVDSRVADNGALNVHYGGVQRIDLTRQGTLTAVALAGQPVVTVVPAPDGQSVYVLGPDKTVGAGSGTTSNVFRLRRLDATTLKLLPERDFDGYRSVLLTSLVSRQNDEGR